MNDTIWLGAGSANGPVSVVVLSPYPSVRAGLRVMLDADARCTVVAETGSVGDALLKSDGAADVFVVDLPSLDALDRLIDDFEQTDAGGLVLLGPIPDDFRILRRLEPHPWAYLPRQADSDELAAAVVTVHSGLLAVHPSIATRLLAGTAASRLIDAPAGEEELTPRELQVLALLAEGIPNKAVARRLGISDHTVKFHVGSLLGKLGASSRTEAVSIGARRGLIAL